MKLFKWLYIKVICVILLALVLFAEALVYLGEFVGVVKWFNRYCERVIKIYNADYPDTKLK
jgi:hypothetical protein